MLPVDYSKKQMADPDRRKDMDQITQQQTVAIDRGLFVVRYAAAEDKKQPPKVTVAPDHGSVQNISLLLHPDHSEAVLWQPDSGLVVRATAAGKLSVEVTPTQEGGSAAATVKIEPLNQVKAKALSTRQKRQNNPRSTVGNVRILGHLSGVGDVHVNANEWMAGPATPLRIEGISIAWPEKPQDLEIHYAVRTAKPEMVSGRKMPLGSFAGTRGKAMPIVALALEMSGPRATNFQFVTEAIFLGSPAMRITGQHVIASGPTGREALVGLRLGIEKVDSGTRPHPKVSSPRLKRSDAKVRVFRSHTSPN
jgi:hypothetical protein